MSDGEFEALVAAAIDGIPDEFARHLENVALTVEAEPSPDLLLHLGLDPRRDTLFGVFQGVPLHGRPWAFCGLPDRITIFAGPLRRACATQRELRRQVRTTVVHEIAHFFGLDEGRIRRLGY
jgi:predicted Zn-dependent protease with MMP-like domain